MAVPASDRTAGLTARPLLGILALVVLGLLLWALRWVLLVLFGAVVLAVALDVPTTAVRRALPLNRTGALSLVLTGLMVIGGWLTMLLLPEVVEQTRQLVQILPILLDRLEELAGVLPGLRELNLNLLEGDLLDGAPLERLEPLGRHLLGVAGGAANSIIQLLLMGLLAVLMALDPRSHQRLVLAATPRFYRPRMQQLLGACRLALGGWLAGMTLSALVVFLLTWAGLALLGVPLALLSGLTSGLLTFVPTIGPTAATLLPLSVALLVSPAKVVQVLLLRLLLQNGEAFLLTPLLLKRTVNLLPTVALMAQLSLGALLGLPGLLLALPLVVVLQVIGQEVFVHDVMDRWGPAGLTPAEAGSGARGTVEAGSRARPADGSGSQR